MTLDHLTNAQLEELTHRLYRHADQAWQRMDAGRTWLRPVDQQVIARIQLRDRIFRRADDLLYRRYTS